MSFIVTAELKVDFPKFKVKTQNMMKVVDFTNPLL